MSHAQVKKDLDYVLDHWNESKKVSIHYVEGKNWDHESPTHQLWLSVRMHNNDEYQIYIDFMSITCSYACNEKYDGLNTYTFKHMRRAAWANAPMHTMDQRGNAETVIFNSYYNILLEHVEDVVGMTLEEFTKDTLKYKVNP